MDLKIEILISQREHEQCTGLFDIEFKTAISICFSYSDSVADFVFAMENSISQIFVVFFSSNFSALLMAEIQSPNVLQRKPVTPCSIVSVKTP